MARCATISRPSPRAGTDDADTGRGRDAGPFRLRTSSPKTLRIREDGRITRTMYLVRVKKPSDSKYPWDYFEVLRSIPPEETVWPLSASKCPLVSSAKR